MRKLLIWIVTIFCPGIIFLLTEEYTKMIIAFALQASLLGWVPAMIWAKRSWTKRLKAEAPKPIIPPVQTATPTATIPVPQQTAAPIKKPQAEE